VARALFAAAFLACVLSAQKPPQPATPQEPPEEDYYFKKPNYSAAAKRYTEATRWDPGSAEAFRKLGETREKLHEYGPAREAYLKFIELGEDAKEKDVVRKKLDKLPNAPAQTAPKSPGKK
jgi:tetratricopeptide (TPR) repeat protein